MPVPLRTLVWLGLLACDQAPTTDSTPTPTNCDVDSLGSGPTLEYGVGEDFFEPIGEGDEILVVYGPQGGYHLDASIRAQGIDPGDHRNVADPRNPRIEMEARDAKGDLVSGVDKKGDDGIIRLQQGLAPTCNPDVFEIGGRRIFLLASDTDLNGQTLTVTVRLEDADGVQLSDTVEVVAVPSPFN